MNASMNVVLTRNSVGGLGRHLLDAREQQVLRQLGERAEHRLRKDGRGDKRAERVGECP